MLFTLKNSFYFQYLSFSFIANETFLPSLLEQVGNINANQNTLDRNIYHINSISAKARNEKKKKTEGKRKGKQTHKSRNKSRVEKKSKTHTVSIFATFLFRPR